MNIQVAIVVLAVATATTSALPHQLAKRQLFPKGFPFHDVDTDDDSGFFNPLFPPTRRDQGDGNIDSFFSLFFNHFEDEIRRMQEELDNLNRKLNGTDVDSRSNTTVVDGHVVTVNETTRTSGDDSDNPFFHHVKVIVIRPHEGDGARPTEESPEPLYPNDNADEVSFSSNDEENEIPQVGDNLEPL